MAPTMPPSVPSAGGSRNVIARCVATRCRRMPCASVASSPGVATSSIPKKEPSWQGSCSKQELLGSLTAFSFLTSGYQLSNDHVLHSLSWQDHTHLLYSFVEQRGTLFR